MLFLAVDSTHDRDGKPLQLPRTEAYSFVSVLRDLDIPLPCK